MDPLSTTASVIAVLQLTSKVIEYISSPVGAKKERKRLREELRACQYILNQIKDGADDSEDGKTWSETLRALGGHAAPLSRLHGALKQLMEVLAPKKDFGGSWMIVKWPFSEKGVQKIICSIEREKSLLGLAVANDSRRLTLAIKQTARENGQLLTTLNDAIKQSSEDNHHRFSDLQDKLSITNGSLNQVKDDIGRIIKLRSVKEQEDSRCGVLDWLAPETYSSRHMDMFGRREPGTCQWFLESSGYQNWLNAGNSTLFCSGIPGAGKTILSAIIINDLISRFCGNPDIAVAYIYCDFGRQREQTADALLASILGQLVQLPLVPESLRALYEQHTAQGTRPSCTGLSITMQSVLSSFSRAFIIVDALDECCTSDRKAFAAELVKLPKRCRANILLTSRPRPDIAEQWPDAIMLEIAARDEDVRKYLDRNMYLLPNFIQPALRQEVREAIVRSAQGMFLLATLHINYFSEEVAVSVKAVRASLEKLTTGAGAYDQVYYDTMKRIEGRTFAMRILAWVTCAKRQLRWVELQHALAIEEGTRHLDEDNLSPVETILSNCAGLVVIDRKTRIVRLAHYTTQHYLKKTQRMWFPDAQDSIAAACLTYLQFESFETGMCEMNNSLAKRKQLNPFYHYAAQHWGHHASLAPSMALRQQLQRFLCSDKHVQASAQILLSSYSANSLEPSDGSGTTSLHLTSYFGLEDAFRASFSTCADPDTRDSLSRTPLSWAAETGRDSIVRLLLDKRDVDVNSRDSTGRTPLSWACATGRASVVALLLDHDNTSADLPDNYGRTPLSYAAEVGHEAIVRRLITENVNINSRYNIFGSKSTSMLYAVRIDGRPVTTILFDGSSMAMMGGFTQPGLGLPDLEEVLDMVDRVRQNGHEIEHGRSPILLSALSAHPNLGVLELVVARDIGNPATYGETPLHLAACQGHVGVVRTLLQMDSIDPGAMDEYKRTPLICAAAAGHTKVIELLVLADGVDRNFADAEGRTALQCAAENGHNSIVSLLRNLEQ